MFGWNYLLKCDLDFFGKSASIEYTFETSLPLWIPKNRLNYYSHWRIP